MIHDSNIPVSSSKICLALSGGGVRAAVFHCGTLLRLAHNNLLEQVVRISTVSGGSLLIGLIFSLNEYRWPTSYEFYKKIYPSIRTKLTSTDLFSLKTILQSPAQWAYIPNHRSKILANFLDNRWGIKGFLSDLPDKPAWIINTTSVFTGKNWRFSKSEMGDWKFGRHYDPPYSISHAIGASASVPYVIGGLNFKLPQKGWYKVDPATSEPKEEIHVSLGKVTLWDGGAYENLGLEPLYKTKRNMIKCKDILLVDASASLRSNYSLMKNLKYFLKGHLASPRLFDISSDQIRSLRSRMFIEALTTGKASGALIKLGNSAKMIYERSGLSSPAVDYSSFLSQKEVEFAKNYPTNLEIIAPENFDLIARHGFECTDTTINSYRKDLIPKSLSWEQQK